MILLCGFVVMGAVFWFIIRAVPGGPPRTNPNSFRDKPMDVA